MLQIKFASNICVFLAFVSAFCACKNEATKAVQSEKLQEKILEAPAKVFKDTTVVIHNAEKAKPSKEATKPTEQDKKAGPKTSDKDESEEKIPEMSIELPQHPKTEVPTNTTPVVNKPFVTSPTLPKPKEEKPAIKETPTATDSEEEQVKEEPAEQKEEEVVIKKFDHNAFDALLQKYVSVNGDVNYGGLLSDKAKLTEYTDALKEHYPTSGDSRNKKLAYFINAYNAFTVLLIMDNYPIASIMDLDNGKVWDRKWIDLGDKTISLNQIEHEILRKQLNEPRVHFAVNCAAKSCPPLYNRAFEEVNVQFYLERRTKAFINDTSQNSYKGNSLELSKIFEWYKEDFGDLLSYINAYRDSKVAKDATINFKEYDWKLNE